MINAIRDNREDWMPSLIGAAILFSTLVGLSVAKSIIETRSLDGEISGLQYVQISRLGLIHSDSCVILQNAIEDGTITHREHGAMVSAGNGKEIVMGGDSVSVTDCLAGHRGRSSLL